MTNWGYDELDADDDDSSSESSPSSSSSSSSPSASGDSMIFQVRTMKSRRYSGYREIGCAYIILCVAIGYLLGTILVRMFL